MEHRFYSVTNTINNISVDWSLSGKMTSKLVIRESESPLPVA